MSSVRLSVIVLVGLTGCGVDVAAVDEGADDLDSAAAASELVFTGADAQFAGGFAPRNAPYGGFGGAADCKATRTPVVFLPGNGDDARNFDFPASTTGVSVYRSFRNAGYKDCELFGVNYLTAAQRLQPMYNYHDAGKAKLVGDFINDVLAYTGKSKVDIIGHSMGVTVGLHALEKGDLGKKLRRFISIGGAMTGLGACLAFGPANPYGPACGSQNWFLGDVFGVHPHSVFSPNRRLSLSGFVATPSRLTDAEFYSIRAGMNDEFLCATNSFYPGCDLTATFLARSNVKSQVNVGWGSTTIEVDYDLKDYSLFKAGGGDLDGVGHFRSKNNTGPIQVKMLSTTCSGAGCCNSYTAPCSAL